jgi:tetratricopeptide (TPR) repeat protein
VGPNAFGGNNPESYYDEGLTASMKGDLPKAIEFFEQTIRMDSSMASAYHQLGKCYSRIGNNRKAVKILAQVVSKRPNLRAAQIDLGNALIQEGQLEEAKKHFDNVLASNLTDGKALLGLALADFRGGNWQDALNHAQEAQVHGGTNFATLYMLGRAAKLAGHDSLSIKTLEKADQVIEKYREMNEEKPEGYFLRGEVAFVMGDFSAAIAQYRSAEDRAELGRAYLAYGESFDMCTILAKQGLCMQRLNEPEKAKEIGERIGRIDADHPLGKALREG